VKRLLAMVLVLALMIGFTSCNVVKDVESESKPNFIGKVIEKYDNSCLVEVVEAKDNYPAKGTEVVVNTDIDDCPQYNVGDFIKIVYNGEIAESYPLQIFNVYEVIKVDENGNEI
jgi:hypothetical protein